MRGQRSGRQGQVELNYVADSTGHVAPNSVHVIPASSRDFVAAAVGAVQSGKFEPAGIGICPVAMPVAQPVSSQSAAGADDGSDAGQLMFLLRLREMGRSAASACQTARTDEIVSLKPSGSRNRNMRTPQGMSAGCESRVPPRSVIRVAILSML